jgi:hypothetical protein
LKTKLGIGPEFPSSALRGRLLGRGWRALTLANSAAIPGIAREVEAEPKTDRRRKRIFDARVCEIREEINVDGFARLDGNAQSSSSLSHYISSS